MILILTLFSKLPFWVLHRVSDFFYVLLFYGIRYRRKVVFENISRAFPALSSKEQKRIEKKFYRNFCDILIETVKYVSISESEFLSRCRLANPELPIELAQEKVNLVALTSHLGNWDALAFATALAFSHKTLAVYKPLSNPKLNHLMAFSRERSGMKMVPIKSLREVLEGAQNQLFALGLLADQAPHHYDRAFQIHFLNQNTFTTPGPGVLAMERNLTPIWIWMKRTGRSRFEWGVERLILPEGTVLTTEERTQTEKLAALYHLNEAQMEKAFLIMKVYSKKLEAAIEARPEDWLWSHRRWKNR